MANRELEALKKEIETLREEINTYIEYPEIFKDELVDSSNKIDTLINKYMILSSK
ncbi:MULTISPECIES: aspartyl-phosphate phosphatase Spo0E family protein [Clostridia]|uniref:aspartyl-phosphate phosphatase Spo0E family protein n=1 Tax=Clostridium sp. CCUG 7971 TaxID=2811414 RepID=UPI001ABA8702|nr:aspartyl-phosphate phosphatase Spo0E family protein [Clostridium sp. CCUG 7971]MBO3444697.1 aspartyl-phosphate phosphatase Spo0E family protein [Clostridium sp. CCUG 7971]